MDKVTVTQEAREAAAIRHSFDGYGWAYIDSGSGSDWHRRGMAEPYAELLYTSDDLASAFAAGKKAGQDEMQARVVEYLRECQATHESHMNAGKHKTASRHHADACKYASAAIERGEHLVTSEPAIEERANAD